MFTLIDYMDEHQRNDVPVQVFFNSFLKLRDSIASKQDSERISNAFDRDNLIKIGVVSEFNASRNTFAFQPAILDVFRLFDKERVRGLRSAELESIRNQLAGTYQQHLPLSFSHDDIDFSEQRSYLFDLLRRINSQVKNNTEHLQHQADRLSHHLDYDTNLLSLHASHQRMEILGQVKAIYDREIIPIMEFLNGMEYSKHKAPLVIIDDLGELYRLRGRDEDSYYISQYKLSILSHYKSAERVKKTLQRYVNQERQHRLTYNAIEKAYLQLQEMSANTFTESLKDNYIFKAMSDNALFFDGLKSHSQGKEARIDWRERNNTLYFNEYLIQQQSRRRSDTSAQISTSTDKKQLDPINIIKRRIKDSVDQMVIKPPINDIHVFMHQVLLEQLQEDYQLHYLLYGVSCLKQRPGRKIHLKVSFNKPQQRIHFTNKVLEYNKREYIL